MTKNFIWLFLVVFVVVGRETVSTPDFVPGTGGLGLPTGFVPSLRGLPGHRCIILLGGRYRNDTPMYYDPEPGVECDLTTTHIRRIPSHWSIGKTAYTSGCYLERTEQIVVRDRWRPSKLPVAYSLKSGLTKVSASPGQVTQESTAASVDGSRCVSCGGGYLSSSGKWSFTDRCYQMDVSKSSSASDWQPIPAFPQHLCCAASATLGRRFYVIGGWSGGWMLNEMYSYDLQQRSWRQEPSLSIGRGFHGAAALSSTELLVCGGCNSYRGRQCHRRDCLIYNSASKRWHGTHSMNRGRHEFGLVSYGGRVYALGGEGGGRTVEVYDRQLGWKMVKPLERQCKACVVVPV